MKEQFLKLLQFITVDIWHDPDKTLSKRRSWLYNSIKTVYLCVDRFVEDRLIVKASALTYSTLLAIVPIVAILFAIARGFGFDRMMEGQLRITLAGQGQVADYIIQFVNRYLAQTKNGIFIGVGLILLLWTVVNLTGNIEHNVNEIWQVKKGRTMYRKLTDYFSMFLVIPVLIVVSGGLAIFTSTMLKSVETFVLLGPFVRFLIQLIPYVFISLVFIVFNIFMPNTKVKIRHAIIPGVLAGVAFQLFQFLYIDSQVAVSKYNAIYGSFAALPLFLFWLQISWTICLFSVQLTYASQNIQNFSYERDTKNISRRYYNFVCILIISLIAKRFEKGENPYTAEELANKYHIPIRLTRQVLNRLLDLNLIHEVLSDGKSEDITFQPSVDIAQLSVSMVMKDLETFGSEGFKVDREGRFRNQWKVLIAYEDDFYEKNKDVLVKDL
jgi:membrane protein